jgi:tRNA modification GTPase
MEADIILWVLDGSVPYSAEDEHVFNEVQGCNVVAILNKSDLPQRIDDKAVESKGIVRLLKISALTGWGLEDVKQCLYEIYEHSGVTHAGLVITHVRHRDLLQKVHSALGRSREAISAALPLEIVALELREALLHLGDIIGETSTDDVLNEIFSRFCIGK